MVYKGKKIFLASLAIAFLMIGVCGCMNNNEKNSIQYRDYAKKIEQKLSVKYGCSFTVDSIGGTLGTHDDSTIKALCYSNDGDFAGAKFMAEIGIDDLIVKDSYLNLKAASMISGQLMELYPGESFVLTQFETPTEYSKNNELTDLNFFLNEFDNYFITSFIFIKTEISNNELAANIYDYGKKLESLHLKDLSVVVFIVDEINAENIKTIFDSSEEKYDSLANEKHVKRISGFQLKDGSMQTSSEDIENEFNKGN